MVKRVYNPRAAVVARAQFSILHSSRDESAAGEAFSDDVADGQQWAGQAGEAWASSAAACSRA
jgi:hypothetical protein